MKNKIAPVVSVLFLLFFSTGCIEINDEFAGMRTKILSHFSNEFESEAQFSVGSVGITISSWIVGTAEDEESDFVDNMMREVDGVQIGVYKKITSDDEKGFSVLNDIEEDMLDNGWKSFIRSYDNGEITGVYLRTNPDEYLKRLFVISSDDDELVIVEVKGDLKELIRTAIKEKGLKIDI